MDTYICSDVQYADGLGLNVNRACFRSRHLSNIDRIRDSCKSVALYADDMGAYAKIKKSGRHAIIIWETWLRRLLKTINFSV